MIYVSSPIGLGHAQRDVAIAGELRKLHWESTPELDYIHDTLLATMREPRDPWAG